jgi:hypothetical protein
MSNDAATDLRAAWDALIAQLQAAREAMDDPQRYPPPPTDRNLAEGYRYLLGFVYGAIALPHCAAPDYWREEVQPAPIVSGTKQSQNQSRNREPIQSSSEKIHPSQEQH